MMKAFQQEKQARARGNKLQIQYHWKCNPKATFIELGACKSSN
jgi:hypothetical protein